MMSNDRPSAFRHRWEPAQVAAARRALARAREHPTQTKYVGIALILAVVTAIEVGVYYVEAIEDVLVPILLLLAATKFAMVAGWFMHLRFDSAVFTWMFAGGLALAWGVFLVVLMAEEILIVN